VRLICMFATAAVGCVQVLRFACLYVLPPKFVKAEFIVDAHSVIVFAPQVDGQLDGLRGYERPNPLAAAYLLLAGRAQRHVARRSIREL
jgi:hypothetical protein